MASMYPPYVYTTQNTTSTILNSYAGSFTINTGGAAGSNITIPNNGVPNMTYSTVASSNLTGAGLQVSGDADFNGNIKWKGRDLGKLLTTMEKRLAILEPNAKKLAKWEALQKAYDHYKLLEALLHEEDNEDGC